MDVLRIVIYDTNPAELERYTAACRAICEKNQVRAIFSAFNSGKALLFEMMDPAFSSRVSILVLEPCNGGEAMAERLRSLGYDGIILYHSWAADESLFYQAFDAGAYNYVNKKGQARFLAVFERALNAALRLERQYIILSCGGEYRQLDLRDIHFFEAGTDHMVTVWYTGGKFRFRSSLSDLEERLKNRGFIRIHRAYIAAIDALHHVSYEEATLFNGMSIPVSRRNYAAVKEALDKRSLYYAGE
ncbi:MAG: LytTR family transcriptional regulator DNA-binding domain-containing protein [Oscillospiraceae bacterium]|nr:LytTR family transcriptional regulator DNA-binding domain-containing protein [Oscillospiraceae bacterium]